MKSETSRSKPISNLPVQKIQKCYSRIDQIKYLFIPDGTLKSRKLFLNSNDGILKKKYIKDLR